MQDNFTPDIDPDWVEEGWSGMRQMLDQEMPVQQRRPFVWVWWSAALLAIGIGTGWLLNDFSGRHTVIGQLPVPSEWARASQNPEHSPLEQEANATGQGDSSPIAGNIPPIAGAAHYPNAALNTSPIPRPVKQSEPNAKVQYRQTASATTSIEQERPLALSPALTAIPPLNALAALSPEPLEKQSFPSLPEQPKTTLATTSPWQPGLFISGLFVPEQGSTGYEAGVFLAWEPNQSRWYSRFSMSYLRLGMNQQLDQRQFALSNSRFSNNPAVVSMATKVEVAHFANTALRAGYQITPGLGLEGGFFMAYLTSAQKVNLWAGTGAPDNSGGTDGSEASLPAFNITNRSQSVTGLSRWSTGWTAGLRYNLSDNFFTTLNYSAPVTGFPATGNQKTILNPTIALSLFGSF